MTPPIQYVLGFLFDSRLERVVLILKRKPLWQAGLFNGVGGKAHTGEADLAAMRREFREETGARITDWHPFARLAGREWVVQCFYAVNDVLRVESKTQEQVAIVEVASLSTRRDTIENVPWLVFAARADYWSKGVSIEARYSEASE